MDKYYVIKKQTKSEDRKAFLKLIVTAILSVIGFYGAMLLFFKFMIEFNKFSKWLF